MSNAIDLVDDLGAAAAPGRMPLEGVMTDERRQALIAAAGCGPGTASV